MKNRLGILLLCFGFALQGGLFAGNISYDNNINDMNAIFMDNDLSQGVEGVESSFRHKFNKKRDSHSGCKHKKRESHSGCSHKKSGPTGPAGAKGPTGPTGPSGAQGPAGPAFNQYASFSNCGELTVNNSQNFTFDTQNCLQGISYDLSTGVFKIKKTGIYMISVYINNNDFFLTINNVSFTQIDGSDYIYTSIIPLNEGDLISITNQSGGSRSFNSSCGELQFNGFINMAQIN